MDDKKLDERRSLLATASFPKKLFELVSTSGCDIVRWEEHGRAFRIINSDLFAEKVLPLYFRHSKITSFQRQLNLYGFRRITKGTDQGAYYHAKFQRGKSDLVGEIRRLVGNGSHHDNFTDVHRPNPTTPIKIVTTQYVKPTFSLKQQYQPNDHESVTNVIPDRLLEAFDNESRLQFSQPSTSAGSQSSDFGWCHPELYEDFDPMDITLLDSLFDDNDDNLILTLN